MELYIVTQQECSQSRLLNLCSGKPDVFGTIGEAVEEANRRIEAFKKKEKGRPADWETRPGFMQDGARHWCCMNLVKEVLINVFVTKTEFTATGKEESGHEVQ